MKKLIKFLLLVLSFSCLTILTGCSSNENVDNIDTSTPVHVAIVIQSVKNVPVINISAADELISEVCAIPNSSISIIVADGIPWNMMSAELDEIDSSFSEEMKEQILKERVQKLIKVATTAVATNPETDMIGAIELATRYLQSYEEGRKELIIFGSCINTVSPLPMQDIILSTMDVDMIIRNLTEQFYIVDLQNINVTIFNLGDTCDSQKPLTNEDKATLKTFWTTFFEAGNANKITFKSNLPSNLIYENLPHVSTVPVVERQITLDKFTKEIVQTGAISFDEKIISFKKGSAILAEPKIAKEAISIVAKYMISNKTEAMLIGCTANWGELEDSISLSYERAKAIKTLFLEAGVNEKQLTVIGTGWLSCFYQNDKKENGELDETIAPNNRTCIWINKSSELTKKIFNDSDFEKFLTEK